ncbi:MAG: 5-formyltetrahydrofolate cyclo-ligase [Oscillospiraceae bacterium]|nr:5-formyltetrahydrofolate cyclo-ligase [Oscillospiraceae bacterium]
MNLKLIKNELREQYKNVRLSLSEDEKNRLDLKIANRVTGLWSFRESDVILCYVSKKIEVGTESIIRAAWRMGKKVAVPDCSEDTREMDFYFISSYDDLRVGAYGLLTPIKERCEPLTDYSQGFCVVPAIAYDSQGYRLGFGKGYYDRFLYNFKGKTAGICYENCMSGELPHGNYDQKVDMVITEKKCIVVSLAGKG